ncbi:MAG: hypothetical protein KJ018_06550 [Burkholderiales bacterium]|nr:hypothetical protein [Burkholderiales bacterium]
MSLPTSPRRSFLRASIALSLAALAAPAAAHWTPPAATAARVDLVDRATGAALPLHTKDGRAWVVGTPGHEYAIRIRNASGERILAVTSVDGVNVITGETASPEQSGYVIEPWGSVEIAGWRKSLRRTAAFYFSEHAQSYAARTGRPFDDGVIGVAVFAEQRPPRHAIGEAKQEERARAAEAEAPAPSADALPAAPAGRAEMRSQSAERAAAGAAQLPAPAAKLGTGHGRSETSYARHVRFERATREPAQIVAIHYDRYENLLAMGVVHAPPRYAHTPRPFPGSRFVPDPR